MSMEHAPSEGVRQIMAIAFPATSHLPPDLTLPPPRHTITVIPRPKMDASSLVATVCACGDYTSGPASGYQADTAGQQHVATATVNDADSILTAGLAWLFDTAQPPEAICTHLGSSRATGDRVFGFIPRGVGGGPVVTMCLTHPAYDDRDNLRNPLTRHDVDALWADLKRRGHAIAASWNGKGTTTLSVQLARPAHPALLAAVDAYHAGCPDHGGTVFCRCAHLDDRHAMLVRPAWPARTPTEVTR